jgi:2-keto-4-pentenoate hydratase
MSERVDLFDPAPATAILAQAWRNGTILTELPAETRPRTMLQGYAIQDRLVADLGQTPVGWKLGMGSALQKRQSGVGRSIAGRVLKSYLYQDGDTVPLPNAAPVTVEFEIAYVLGRDVRPEEAPCPVLEAVREVRVAFELVLSRYKDRRAVGWPSFAADNGAFQALVLGQTIDAGRIPELSRELVVSLNGSEAARSLSGEDVTDPQGALEDLVAIARERGTVLPAGSIVSTGTVSKPFTLSGQAEVSASFGGEKLGFRTELRQGNAA